ncbi:hypothetical protein BV898_19778 [Hypsibius exemplaris]|uniref:Uncharacterized protein n=1 Tax=Hypsibius exemplaris TaxID=2072580 RepID=A0A9X6NJP5_HYPEX|nr:hypothetical protein BV898_19778 [Hypsibius exemplaris]
MSGSPSSKLKPHAVFPYGNCCARRLYDFYIELVEFGKQAPRGYVLEGRRMKVKFASEMCPECRYAQFFSLQFRINLAFEACA